MLPPSQPLARASPSQVGVINPKRAASDAGGINTGRGIFRPRTGSVAGTQISGEYTGSYFKAPPPSLQGVFYCASCARPINPDEVRTCDFCNARFCTMACLRDQYIKGWKCMAAFAAGAPQIQAWLEHAEGIDP